jgi:hypothetical protein
MSALALDYVYRYAFHSELRAGPAGSRLRLATFGGAQEHPHFFEGTIERPRRAADLLRGLMQIVHARFHVPPAMLARILLMADPVVTSNEDRLRFEGFSGCSSAYARVDLLPHAVAGETFGRGTTNVDFNPPMLAALAKIRDTDRVALSVGAKQVRLERDSGSGQQSVIEKKVALPIRWLKGFVEVQSYQARMRLVHDVPGLEALRFLRSLPRTKTRHAAYVVPSGRGLRMSQQPARDGVRVAGLERLRVLEALAPHARQLRIYGDEATETCAWELVLDEARFHLVLSPDVWRGFSGEGQALTALAGKDWQADLPKVRAALQWQSTIDPARLAQRTGTDLDSARAALAALGARGLVGFDLGAGCYFHRELPFDLSQVESLQPRLKAARKMLDEGKARVGSRSGDQIEVFVAGSGVEHRVRLTAAGPRCTCPWFSKHQGQRGPCKHVLAAQMLLDP